MANNFHGQIHRLQLRACKWREATLATTVSFGCARYRSTKLYDAIAPGEGEVCRKPRLVASAHIEVRACPPVCVESSDTDGAAIVCTVFVLLEMMRDVFEVEVILIGELLAYIYCVQTGGLN